jgi:uncharacterized protein (UPF0332 family)
MNRDAAGALSKAREALRAAHLLLNEGLADTAASEAYYAMFHAASAALAQLGQSYSKHSAVIAAFGREFAKTKTLPTELHRDLREGFQVRQRATYDYHTDVPATEAQYLLDRAEQFIDTVADYLREHDGC